MRTLISLLLGVVFWQVLAGTAAAQTNDEVFPQFQWNFSTPGARANAMGRAFIGLADDATAAITNPAGLTALTRPQVYVELKSNDLKVNRLAVRDSLFSAQTSPFGGTINSVPFFAASMPLLNGRVAVGVSRSEFLNYQESFSLTSRTIPDSLCTSPISRSCRQMFPETGSTDFRGSSLGASVAVNVNKMVKVGFTVARDMLDAKTRATRFEVARPDIVLDEASIDSSSSGTSATVGVLFKPTDKISAGITYTKAPTFQLQELYQFNVGDCEFFTCPGGVPSNQPLRNYTSAAFINGIGVEINVPDRIGLGVSARPTPRLTVAFDAVRINYSKLAKNFTIIFGRESLTSSNFAINDVTEIHAGGEYTLFDSLKGLNAPVLVRAGVFTNPAHRVQFIPGSNSATNDFQSAVFNTGTAETQVKGTIGAGLVFSRRVQMDLAYVWKQDVVLSAAYRF